MYRSRLLRATVERALGQFPAVLVTGPRQAGKTTFLAEELGQGAVYRSLDDPIQRDFARTDPVGFLDQLGLGAERGPERAILDEIQAVPELLPHLKVRIDRERQVRGRWILTGSQQFQLMARVGESLAGRVAVLELLPFSLLETPERGRSLAEVVWNGGYPEPALEPGKRDLWMSSYLQTYVERDVRQLHNVQDLRTFESFVALAATRHGQELHVADLARSIGVSQPTARAWISVLEAAFILRLLPPYFENFGKRVIKSPKLYFLDSALPCVLTRQPSAEAALGGAMGGALLEGWVVAEAYKVFAQRGLRPDLHFWRSHDGLEVDLLIRLGGRLCPIEVKSTATPQARHVEPLERFRALTGEATTSAGIVVCRTSEPSPLPGGRRAIPWHAFPAWLDEELSSPLSDDAGRGRRAGARAAPA